MRATVAVTAWALVLLVACERPAPRRDGRVLIVGIDGAAPGLVRSMMEEGRLPNLKQLADAGASGPLRSMMPLLSPRVWTSVATGKRPGQHGVNNWTVETADGSTRLMNSHDRSVHALWNIATDAGLSVATVNWLMTYPVEPVDGVVLSDLALPGSGQARHNLWVGRPDAAEDGEEPDAAPPAPSRTHPASWQQTVDRIAADPGEPLTSVADPFVDNQRIPGRARWLSTSVYQRDQILMRLALMAEEEARPDVMMVLLQGIDRTCHWLWGGFEPPEIYPEDTRFSPAEREAAAAAVRAVYEFTDQLLGLLLERYGDDDMIIVLSDHGFEGGPSTFRMSGRHDTKASIDGVLFARAPGIRAGTTLEAGATSVLDITPAVLTWLGLPVAEDMVGRPPAFLTAARPPATIRTYETKAVPRLPFLPAGVEDDMLEDLRSLGYLK